MRQEDSVVPSSRSLAGLTPVRTAVVFTVALRVVYFLAAVWARSHVVVNPVVRARNGGSELGPVAASGGSMLRFALLGVWERFDTQWYLHLAAQGYDRPAAVVFYPLYPALIHLFGWVFHPPIAAALVVSTLGTFLAIWGLQALLELDYSRSVALRVVVLLAVWPASFSLFLAYADPLVLASVVWSLYFGRKGRWLLAGATGVAGGLAKAVGCLVVFPLVYLAVREGEETESRGHGKRLAMACLPVLGPAGFGLWSRLRGYPSASVLYAMYWKTRVAFPWETLTGSVRELAQHGDALLGLNLVMLLVALCAALHPKVRVEYKLFAAAALTLFLTKSTDPLLQSTARYVLVVFPAFLGICLALRRRPLVYFALCGVCALLNFVFLEAYFGWSLVV